MQTILLYVLHRDHIRGVPSDVIFINHKEQETIDDDMIALGTSSKINMHEVNMVVEIVNYLLQQMYTPNEIVVLTPYLGQLVALQSALTKRELAVDIGDLDKGELAKAHVDLEPNSHSNDNVQKSSENQASSRGEDPVPFAAPPAKSAVRVATIDNFQGEEARIIIGSLVRSNADGDIGFMSSAERVNVFCSRARDGFIIIGNEDTYRHASSTRGRILWNKLLDKFSSRSQIFPGFPIVCQNHKTQGPRLSSPRDFRQCTPFGGCLQQCCKPILSCPNGHLCTKRCHPVIDQTTGKDVHDFMVCTYEMVASCTLGHPVIKICGAESHQPCQREVYDLCPNGHSCRRRKCCDSAVTTCFICKDIERKRIELEKSIYETSQRAAMDLQRAEERRNEAELALYAEKIRRDTDLSIRRMLREEQLALSQTRTLKCQRGQLTVDFDLEIAELNKEKDSNPGMFANPEQQVVTSENNIEMEMDESMPIVSFTCILPAISEECDYSHISKKSSLKPGPTPDVICSNSNTINSSSNTTNLSLRHENSFDLANIYQAMDKESYSKSFKLCNAQLENTSSNASNKNMSEKVNIIKLECLLCLTKLFLGHNVNDNLVDLEVVKASALALSVYPTSNNSEEGEEDVTSLIHFSIAVAEHKLGSVPLSASQHANYYLSKTSSSLISSYPKRWELIAEDIANPKFTIKTVNLQKKSSSDERWENIKSMKSIQESVIPASSSTSSPSFPIVSIDSLMSMIGIESIKSFFIDQFEKIEISQEQSISLGQASYNAKFEGNPGTGKTTVAKLYAQFLIEMKVLPKKSIVIETSGSELTSGRGVETLKKHLEKIKEVGGGVVFLDEAYQLSPQDDREGRQVLDFLLVHAEKLEGKYGRVVWIFAGYADKMEKLFEHNPGLPSRFPCNLNFDDFTDLELIQIFNSLLLNNDGGESSADEVVVQPVQTKLTSIAMPFPSGRGRGRVAMSNHSDQLDKWGNLWTWNSSQSTWEDKYDNITGIGPDYLGHASNPLVSRKDNSMWIFSTSSQRWKNITSPNIPSQKAYPGHPPTELPPPAAPPILSLKPFRVSDEKWTKIAINRLGKMRGKVGFGNARSVRVLFDKVRQRQASRLAELRSLGFRPDVMEFQRGDLLGPRADRQSLESSIAYRSLMAMEGLASVKAEIDKFLELVMQNAEREEAEKKMIDVSLNYVFLGNPGTGKTTVAKLFGRILADLGLLSKGDVIIKNPSDFVGAALGTSEKQTRAILHSAEGCVLVIDEAYLLNGSGGSVTGGSQDIFKAAVVDTLVEQVQGQPGDDRAVILLGYRKQMEAMFAACNPGFSRRFQMENAFEFEDYDDDALLRILMSSCKSAELGISLETAAQAIEQLAKAKAQPNFGNAGAVNNLLSKAKLRMQERQARLARSSSSSSRKRKSRGGDGDTLLPEDFGVCEMSAEAGDLFSGLVGCEKVLSKLQEYKDLITLCQSNGEDPKKFLETNFVFTGSPGTGKTTIARRMGLMFYSLGLMPCSDVVEVSATDFLTGYAGQAGKKTVDILTKARGKVLFIDEAYRLNPAKGGPFMQEVVDELVQLLTSEEFKGRLVVILAGYAADMEAMLAVNQGLKSRFSETINFDNFSLDATVELLTVSITRSGMGALSDSASVILPKLAQDLIDAPSFGNGRDIETLVKRITRAFARRLASTSRGGLSCSSRMIEDSDLLEAFGNFIEEKKKGLEVRGGTSTNSNVSSDLHVQCFESAICLNVLSSQSLLRLLLLVMSSQ